MLSHIYLSVSWAFLLLILSCICCIGLRKCSVYTVIHLHSKFLLFLGLLQVSKENPQYKSLTTIGHSSAIVGLPARQAGKIHNNSSVANQSCLDATIASFYELARKTQNRQVYKLLQLLCRGIGAPNAWSATGSSGPAWVRGHVKSPL